MAYIKHQDLFKLAISAALQDRVTYLDAVSGNPEDVVDVRADIDKIKTFVGKDLKASLEADKASVFMIFMNAECWYLSLWDAQHGKDKRQAGSVLDQLKKFRHEHMGYSQGEVYEANAKPVLISDMLKNPDAFRQT